MWVLYWIIHIKCKYLGLSLSPFNRWGNWDIERLRSHCKRLLPPRMTGNARSQRNPSCLCFFFTTRLSSGMYSHCRWIKSVLGSNWEGQPRFTGHVPSTFCNYNLEFLVIYDYGFAYSPWSLMFSTLHVTFLVTLQFSDSCIYAF